MPSPRPRRAPRRPRHLLHRLTALATAGPALALLGVVGTAEVAHAAPGDGTVSVRVVQDYNANGSWDDPFVEPGMAGVQVTFTDAAGTVLSATTDADGRAELVGAPGAYRVQVVNPDPATYNPAFASEKSGTADTPSTSRLSSGDEFVTVAADRTVSLTTGFWEPRDYCQSNPLIVNACQPPIFTPGGSLANNATSETLFTAPYRANGNDRGKTDLSTKADTGSVYGIGYRKQDRRIFAAAYAKRGVAYGPGGPGAIYTVSADGGPTTVWGTVPNVGTRAHSFDTAGLRQDWDFAPAVGKESLGDLDVSEDGDDLQVINLFTRELLVYDATAPTMGAPTHTVDLSANPGCAAASDWRPGALGERNNVLYVGGVCSAESTQNPADMRAIILTFDATTYAQTGVAMDQTINRKRQYQWYLANRCDPRDTADGVNSTSFRPWSNTISCTHKNGGRLPDPQAWMDDIVIENNGDLVMAFRDRTGDQQMGANSRYFANTDGTGALVGAIDYVVAGDINKACPDTNGVFTLDINGGCGVPNNPQTAVSGEYFGGDGGVHNEEAYGGLALSRGERGIVSSAMDPAGGIFTQGYFRMDRETGRPLIASGGGTSPTSTETLQANSGNSGGNRITGGDSFSKGQGMADMEVLCDLAPIQIGNRVWNDADGDGIQDAGEAGIAGVTVNLYDAAGNLVATTVTNSRGEYYFDSVNDGLEPGTAYVVRLDNPADYGAGKPLDRSVVRLTGADQGTGPGQDRLDSDGRLVGGYPQTSVTTGDHGYVDHTLDFGFRPVPPAQVSVGDFVWVDLDGDGIQDAGEPGIPGVVLYVRGPNGQPVTGVNGQPVGPVTTDADGRYSFDGLPPLPAGQSYTVTIDQTAASTQTALAPYVPTQAGAGTDPALDSSTWTATSGDLVNDGDRDPTLDFGFMPRPVSVGNFVWVDTDFDGVQDPGEPGIPGVVLFVRGPDGNPVVDVDGNPVGPVTTDANGQYLFTGLPVLQPGESYTVSIDRDDPSTVAALAPYVPTTPGAGGDPALDSSTWTATSGDLTTPDSSDLTLDFGFVPRPVSVGNFVWVDTDGDGIQDPGEPGIPGVVLVLTGPNGQPVTDVDGNPVGPVTTDANGFYVFSGLPVLQPGQSYTVSIDRDAPSTVTALAPYVPTIAGAGGDPALDSSTWTASSGDLTTPNSSDMTLDFGFVPAAVSVGNFVWVDTDKDGIQDAGEPGIPGVVLVLTGPDGNPVTDVDGNPVGPVTTGPNGEYLFDNLPPLPAGQHYTVSIDREDPSTQAALAPYVPTRAGAGDDRGADSSTWVATSGDLTDAGDSDLTLDFGFVPATVSVGDFVWVDQDFDGVQDPGEPGIPGVVLVLTGPNGQPVTDVDGNPVGPVTTDADGKYSFDNLPPLAPGESYTVSIDRDAPSTVTALAPYVPTTPGAGGDPALDSSTWTASSGDLTTDGASDLTLDFGFTPKPVSVGDFVWVDTDRDGIQDPGEPGIPGVVLVLTGPNGQPVTDVDGNPVGPVTTDANGFYVFSGLPVLQPGQSYTVSIDRDAPSTKAALAPYTPTIAGAGGDPALDSSTWTASSGDLTVPDARDMTLDFGFVLSTVSVGDFVWLDTDKDGIQDAGEPGIPGVVLILTGPDGNPVNDVNGNAVPPQTTDADGRYSFDNLPPLPAGQHYTVSVDRNDPSTVAALGGLVPTRAGVGPDRGADSSTWTATSGDLVNNGDRDPTLDFGFYPAAVSVGDFVWVDRDDDGIQDPGEPGIPGVVLVLTGPDGLPVTDVAGNPVGPVTTDGNGRYSFDNLPPLPAGQHYTVSIDRTAPSTVTALAPYVPARAGQGPDRGADSSTWTATSRDLVNDGDRDPTLDFGFVAPHVSVGNLVWVDTDRDGVQDPGEPGIKGVIVVLTGPDGNPVVDVYGNPVRPVATDAQGHFVFDNLPPLPPGQSYTVSVDLAATQANGNPLAGYVTLTPGASASSTVPLSGNGASDMGLQIAFVRAAGKPAITTRTSRQKALVGVRLHDRVRISGFTPGGTATGSATLYGPFTSRAAMRCTPANAVRTVRFAPRNGTINTPKVTVGQPGFYTWVARTTKDDLNAAATHACGLRSETTLVHRKANPVRVIDTGFTGRVVSERGARPVRLTYGALGIRSAVLPTGVSGNRAIVPAGIGTTGWLRTSARLGDAIGTSVIVGHVSDRSDRPGALYRLSGAKKGQRVTLRDSTGKLKRYRVELVRSYDRSKPLPARLFSMTGKARVQLVTCTDKVVYPNGRFHYRSNLVVTLVPVG